MSDTNEVAAPSRALKPIDTVRKALEQMRPQFEMALPKHLTADRLLRVAITACQNTPRLLECDRKSLYGAIMTCAQLGLEPDGVLGQAYLVPFAGKVQFIPGYKGFISLARNSGDVTSISAQAVHKNDTFEFDMGSGEPPKHTFDLEAERGDVIAFYAIARFKDGGLHWDMMLLSEILAIRDRSQGWKAFKSGKTKDNPWGTDFNEMAKKTVIRRIAKYLPLSVQKAAALADAYDRGVPAHLGDAGELVIEGTASEVVEEAGPTKSGALDALEEQIGTEAKEPAEAA